MCRWMAYSGSPVLLEELLIKPTHSLIDQSLHSTLGAETTNGDGFGLGWYGIGEGPAVYHSVAPAWNDRNLVDLARPSAPETQACGLTFWPNPSALGRRCAMRNSLLAPRKPPPSAELFGPARTR